MASRARIAADEVPNRALRAFESLLGGPVARPPFLVGVLGGLTFDELRKFRR